MTALLELTDLQASYGQVKALHGVDLTLQEGEVTALLGANGAGKTTTLRAICGMIRTQGAIRFEGRPIAGWSTENIVRLGIAHVPEGRGTFVRLNVDENLRLGAAARCDRSRIAADMERIYGYFPSLAQRRAQQAGTLSGGEQQMLAVGRALMLRPRLMLLDEPSFGLAPIVVRELFDILAAVSREQKVSMLLVEQNAALALALANTGYLLETGRVVMSGPAQKIREDEAVRRAYLGY